MMFWADGPWHAGGGGGPACLIVGLLVIGGLVAGGLWWWKRRSSRDPSGSGSGSGSGSAASAPSQGSQRPSAEDILAERYARGEISDDEYMQRKSVLDEGRS